MKKNKVRYWKSRTFLNYLLSYVGIFLLFLGIFGIVAVGKICQNMKEEEYRIAKNKLYTIVQDMENQMEAMQETALKIATTPHFRFENFQENKYQEVEMLEELKRYNHVRNISDLFFVKYEEANNIFTSSGTVMPLHVYLKKNFDKACHEELTELLRKTCTGEGDRLVLYKQGDLNLFIFSLERYSVVPSEQKAVLCFEISESGLKQRIENVVGVMNGTIYIDYRGFCILGDKLNEDELLNVKGKVLKHDFQDGNFSVCFIPDKNSFPVWQEIFSGKDLTVFVLGILLILVLEVLVAWWNFKPVRRIAEKLGSGANRDWQADWNSIEELIDSFQQGSERNSEMLKIQYQVLREQITLLIISGEYTKRVQEHMIILNICMNAPVYGLIRCEMEKKSLQEERSRELYSDVIGLEEEGISLYPCWDNCGDFYILSAMEEEYQMEDIMELLSALLEAKEIQASVSLIGVYRSLNEIGKRPVSFAAAETNPDAYEENKSIGVDILQIDMETQTERSSTKQNQTAIQAVAYIEANCASYDISLESVAQKFQITSSYLCKIIKQETGMNYKEYLTGLRMEIAKEMIKNPENSVQDVCQQIGYSNVSHFIRVFHKHTGKTPAKYRDEQSQIPI